MALLLGLFRTDLLANDISAVTRVMEILEKNYVYVYVTQNHHLEPALQLQFSVIRMNSSYRPSNLCLRKSKSAFCIMSVTCTGAHSKSSLSALLDFTLSPHLILQLQWWHVIHTFPFEIIYTTSTRQCTIFFVSFFSSILNCFDFEKNTIKSMY